MTVFATLQEIAARVQVGSEVRAICPVCNGGSTREHSLSIRRNSETSARYCCYRASCDLGKGMIALTSDGSRVVGSRFPAKPVDRPYHSLHTYPLSQEGLDLLNNKYHLTDDLILYARIKHDKYKRFIIPIFDMNHVERGKVVRKEEKIYESAINSKSVPKKLLFKKDANGLSNGWYRKFRYKKKASDTLVVVEDALSALRLVPYCDSLYLNTASITMGVVNEIRSQRYDDIVLALDNDATSWAFKQLQRKQDVLPQMRLMFLTKDIKNCNEQRLNEIMDNYGIG